jgi:hypothetical protein
VHHVRRKGCSELFAAGPLITTYEDGTSVKAGINRSELLIIIRPRVMRDGEDARR